MTKTMQEIVAGTKWTVGQDPTGIYLQSDDFGFDPFLEVTGDFPSLGDHLAYAQALADRLNGGAE